MRKSIYSQDYLALVRLMKRLREERGLSQGFIAGKLGITASQFSKWERRERRIDVSELRLYCLAIGVPLGELIDKWEAEIASLNLDELTLASDAPPRR
jgi:transcriptional regulator with XRE-family HTH domain